MRSSRQVESRTSPRDSNFNNWPSNLWGVGWSYAGDVTGNYRAVDEKHVRGSHARGSSQGSMDVWGETHCPPTMHPQVQFERNKMRKMPVWVRIYGLPFPLWSTEGLSRAASMIGMPLSCDEATYNGTRLDYARLCVEIAAEEEFVHKFEMESSLSTTPITIRVEYEWKPARCSQCKVFGHNCQKQGNRGGQDAQGYEEGLGEEGTLNPQETVPKTTPLPQPSYLLTKNNGKQPLISIPQLEEDLQSTVGNVNLAPKNQSHKTTTEAKHISMAPSSSQTPTNLPNLEIQTPSRSSQPSARGQ
uniref:Uncharacterized protein n=1 Tax=Salix viminalis TaxID=40686 RepID=A0A6N2MSR5_SALVM